MSERRASIPLEDRTNKRSLSSECHLVAVQINKWRKNHPSKLCPWLFFETGSMELFQELIGCGAISFCQLDIQQADVDSMAKKLKKKQLWRALKAHGLRASTGLRGVDVYEDFRLFRSMKEKVAETGEIVNAWFSQHRPEGGTHDIHEDNFVRGVDFRHIVTLGTGTATRDGTAFAKHFIISDCTGKRMGRSCVLLIPAGTCMSLNKHGSGTDRPRIGKFVDSEQKFNDKGRYGTCNYIDTHHKFNDKGVPYKRHEVKDACGVLSFMFETTVNPGYTEGQHLAALQSCKGLHTEIAYPQIVNPEFPKIEEHFDECAEELQKMSYSEKWYAMYKQLEEHFRTYGDANIGKGNKLGNWVMHQRKAHKENKLTKAKILLLESLGVVWDVFEAKWMEKYHKLEHHYETMGAEPIHNKQLRLWASRQRQRYNNPKPPHLPPLSDEHIAKLNSLEFFSWDPFGEQWKKMFMELQEFKKNYGNCRPKKRSGSLGEWVIDQRRTVSPGSERWALLNQIGFWAEHITTEQPNKHRRLV